jgi:hypothetical protein
VEVTTTTPFGAYPTGSVTLAANGKTLAAITSFQQGLPGTAVSYGIQGWAIISGNQLAYGPNLITATYSGDNNYTSSSGTVPVTLTGSPSSGFTLSNSGNITVSAGATSGNTATITATPAGGFTGRVNLSCALTTVPTNPYGTVVPAACSIPASLTISGSSAATATLTVNTTSTTTAGAYVVAVDGVDATTGRIMANTAVNVNVNPAYGFTLSNSGNITLSAGATTGNAATITVTPFGGFSGQVNLLCTYAWISISPSGEANPATCGLPTAVTVISGSAATAPLTVKTTSTTSVGSYGFTVTGTDAATGDIIAYTTVSVTVNPAYGFTLSNSGNITVNAGATTGNTTMVSLTPFGGFTGQVNLTCAVSSGVSKPAAPPTCSIPSSVTITGAGVATATLAVATTSTTTAEGYVVTVTGADAATGTMTASTSVNVTVTIILPGFALSSSGNITVAPGATTGNTTTISVTPSGGFTGQVNLTCAVSTSISNPVDPPTCTIPSSVTISGAGAATATLTVNTTAASSSALRPSARPLFLAGGRVMPADLKSRPALPILMAGLGIMLAMVLFFGIPTRRRGWCLVLGLLVVILCMGGFGCGGGGSSGQPPPVGGTTLGTYTATVTGTDAATGKITSSTTVTITVN